MIGKGTSLRGLRHWTLDSEHGERRERGPAKTESRLRNTQGPVEACTRPCLIRRADEIWGTNLLWVSQMWAKR
jgi:hypothetical protein